MSWVKYVKGYLRTRGPMNEAQVQQAFRRVAQAAGLPKALSPYSLRHSYATGLLARGVSLLWVSQQLGHSSPDVTLHWYGWALPEGRPGLSDALDEPASRAPRGHHTAGGGRQGRSEGSESSA